MASTTAILPTNVDENIPRLLELISSGSFGKVYRSLNDRSEEVAVKVIPLNGGSTNYDSLNQELYISKLLKHPNIVTTYDIIRAENAVYVVQEYCSRGDFFDVIPPLVGIQDEVLIKKYFRQLVSAVNYMHSLNYVHRDIKPENLVLTVDDDVRLIDFGLSGPEDDIVEPCTGTIPYMAPEVFNRRVSNQLYNGKAADVFSLGIVLYVMICGCYPWDSPSYHEPAFSSFISNGCTFTQKSWSLVLEDIFRGCLNPNPVKRCTAAELQTIISQDIPWGLDPEFNSQFCTPYSIAVNEDHHDDLHCPHNVGASRSIDIVFSDNSRGDSTDGSESVRSFPPNFNPLTDMPIRRQRFTSECDGLLEIRFDSNMTDGPLLTTHGFSTISSYNELDEDNECDEDNTPRWSWGGYDSEEDSSASSDRKHEDISSWGDLSQNMSFSRVPTFGASKENIENHSNETVSEMHKNEAQESSKWSDMSRDMSFNTLPQFDDDLVSTVGLSQLPSCPEHHLFSVGIDDQCLNDDISSFSKLNINSDEKIGAKSMALYNNNKDDSSTNDIPEMTTSQRRISLPHYATYPLRSCSSMNLENGSHLLRHISRHSMFPMCSCSDADNCQCIMTPHLATLCM